MSEEKLVRPSGPGVKLSDEDFLLFPDDGMRHELIDGAHYWTPSPNTKHQSVSGNLYWLLRSYLEEHPIGKIFHAAPESVCDHVAETRGSFATLYGQPKQALGSFCIRTGRGLKIYYPSPMLTFRPFGVISHVPFALCGARLAESVPS